MNSVVSVPEGLLGDTHPVACSSRKTGRQFRDAKSKHSDSSTSGRGVCPLQRLDPEPPISNLWSYPDSVEINDPKSAFYFRNHDSTHVVFGTHTGELQEGINDLWTIFGVDIRLRDYAGGFFATDESKTIVKQFKLKSMIRILWQTVRLWPELRRRARAMTKKWPWTPPEVFLDRPLNELRAEFGIELLRPEIQLGLERPA